MADYGGYSVNPLNRLELSISENGEINVSGSIDLGYIGLFGDSMIEIDDTPE